MRLHIRRSSEVGSGVIPQAVRTRNGFTMVELLTVIAVISLLLAIMIPAVMSARQSAGRLDCENRLRQFGVAIHGFASTHRHLPVGVQFNLQTGESTDWRSAQVQFLPYLEQRAVYDQIQNSDRIRWADPVTLLTIPVFHCPLDPSLIGINYRVCTGRNVFFFQRTDGNTQLDVGHGAFAGVSSVTPIRFSDITDGLSVTAAMSERVISTGPGQAFNIDRDIWYSGAMLVGFDPDQRSVEDAVTVCRAFDPGSRTHYSPYAGHDFVKDGFLHTGYNHVSAPNSETPDCTLDRVHSSDPAELYKYSSDWGVVGPRSLHQGKSVSLLLMDGAVRPISPYVDLEVWRALGARKDGDGPAQVP